MSLPDSTNEYSPEEMPEFIRLLRKGERRESGKLFAEFALRTLRSAPPRPLSSVPQDEREDVIQEVLLHFWEDDQRRLLSYEPRGKSFKKWFYTVAWNKILTILDRKRPRTEPIETAESSFEESLRGKLADKEYELQDAWSRLLVRIQELDERDQLLLWCWANGIRPRHMPPIIGEPEAIPTTLAERIRYLLTKKLGTKRPKREGDSDAVGDHPYH